MKPIYQSSPSIPVSANPYIKKKKKQRGQLSAERDNLRGCLDKGQTRISERVRLRPLMPASLSSAKLPLTISRFAALGEIQQQNRGGPTDMKPQKRQKTTPFDVLGPATSKPKMNRIFRFGSKCRPDKRKPLTQNGF